jgi:hypothetical protein
MSTAQYGPRNVDVSSTTVSPASGPGDGGTACPPRVGDGGRSLAEGRGPVAPGGDPLEVAGATSLADEGQWRLVVAEDCDEYLRADARARAGASLGWLLTLCDGILGHGLRVVLLHPAVVRPGRCLAQVPFERFPRAQAEAWLGAGAQVPRESLTLVELYALGEERPADDPRPSPLTPGHAAPRVDAMGTSATPRSDPRLATVPGWPQS